MTSPPRSLPRSLRALATRLVAPALLVLLAAGGAAGAADRGPGPGFVDGSAFADMADEAMEVVEIHIPSTLLEAASELFRSEDPDAASLLSELRAVNAVILGIGDEPDPARIERVSRLVKDTEKRLERSGWERVVRVREPGNSMGVFILSEGKTVVGLVVLGFDRDEGQVVFANIAGVIDLARIGELGETLEIPGLEDLPPMGRGGER